MAFEERQYQTDCVDAWVEDLKDIKNNPLVAVPTGAGKTVILCKTLIKWFDYRPDSNVLILSHTSDIVQQDYDAMSEFFPEFGMGIYSASLKTKETNKITIGTVGSIYNSRDLFTGVDLCIVDEAHAINHKDKGMYRKIFNNIGCQVAGMSATIFRTNHGYIFEGEDALFNKVSYDLTSVYNFNKLVKDGYLTELISKATDTELDSSGIAKVGGDYNLKQLAAKHDRDYITKLIVEETIKYGKNYKKWLIFAIDIKHANHIYEELVKNGIEAEELHTYMDGDRQEVTNNFKYGSTRALVSVGMVTTGFDSPNIDLIAIMRPTISPVLHVQMVGRGLRVSPGKKHCLVLDFAGNTEKLGPINNPLVKSKNVSGSKKKNDDKKDLVLAKKCPKCKCYAHPVARFCKICGHEYKFKTNLRNRASKADIVQKEKKDWYDVDDVVYNIHHKAGSFDSLKVSYICGSQVFTEWVCLNHPFDSFTKRKANKWIKRRSTFLNNPTTEEAYANVDKIAKPSQIKIKRDRYISVTQVRF